MSHKLLCRSLLAGVSIVSLSIGHARAQAVDYGSFEQMFGEPVTTSVTGSPQRVSEAPANVQIITQDDIQKSGADNIPDVLQFVTGIDTRRYSFGQSDIAIRGFDQALNPRVLVLINGRQAYLDDYGYVSWDSLPVQLDEIRQIEIVKGPNSALFGFNAASGVINIITFDPVYDKTNAATLRGGTQSVGEGSAVTTVPIGKTAGVRISVGGLTGRNYETLDAYNPENPRTGSANIAATWHVTSHSELTAELGTTDSRSGSFLADGYFGQIQNRTNDERVGGSVDTRVGTVSLDAYRNETRDQYTLPLGSSNFDNVVYVMKANDLAKPSASTTVRVGLEYRNNSATGPDLSNTMSYDDYAASLMGDWNVTHALSAMAAVRIDEAVLHHDGPIIPTPGRTSEIYNNTTLTEPTFNVGLAYAATAHDTGRLTFARGLQMPSLLDFGIQAILPAGGLVGNPSLSPTAVWNAEVDWDHVLTVVPATFTTAVFFQRNDNLLAGSGLGNYIVLPGPTYLGSANNVGSANAVGVELGLKGTWGPGFRWNASYRFMSITDDITAGALQDAATDPQHGTPDHVVVLGAGYTTGKWDLDAQGRWQSSYRDYRTLGYTLTPVDVSNYVTLNARVGYRINRFLSVSGWAEQFNVSRLQMTAGSPVERRFLASITAHL